MTPLQPLQEVLRPLDHTDASWQIRIEETPRWIRVSYGGETIADSKSVLIVTETGHLPIYYFPREDVRIDLLEASPFQSHCTHKGTASYWSIRSGGRLSENAAWSYEAPKPGSEALAGYIAFYWKKVDAWYEEEEQIFVHARDPYKRVDALPSSRHIQVVIGGEVVADSNRAVIVYETYLTPRYYLPKEDIRLELLEPTGTVTQCPYKGIASYWNAKVRDQLYRDVVWSYADPLPEIPQIAGLLSFYNERVDAIYIDGEKWSQATADLLPSQFKLS